MVTAEAAVVLPLVALAALALVWLLTIGIADVWVIDAARDAARSLAKGDTAAGAVRAARRTAGEDASVRIQRRDGLVSVTVTRRVSAPGWLLVPLPSVTVHADSTVAVEGDGGG